MKILHIVGGSPNSGAYKGAEILQISDDNKMVSMGSGAKGNILTRLVQKT